MVQGNNPCYLPTKHHLHYLLYKNWTQQVCLCLRECLMAGFYLSCSTLSFHIGDRFSSCLNLGRDTEASEVAEIRNRLHFFCTERTVKRPESMFAAARTEELTAVGTIDAHQFPGILLPAPLWWIAIFCKHIWGQKKEAQEVTLMQVPSVLGRVISVRIRHAADTLLFMCSNSEVISSTIWTFSKSKIKCLCVRYTQLYLYCCSI